MRAARQKCLLRSTGTSAMRQETITKRDKSPVEAAVSAVILNPAQAARPFDYHSGQALPLQRARSRRISGFTLAELLVTTGVLVLLVVLASQLFNSAATITTLGYKQMDADSQARQLLDRIEIDFVQMIKRSDVDYYLKSNPSPSPTQYRYAQQQGNDIIAFYGAVPGYLPTSNHKSPISLVAYRVNSDSSPSSYNKY